MNHSNLKLIIDQRNKHPYAAQHRLQFFATHAGVKLVRCAPYSKKHKVTLAIVKG